jgi:hypothetical protein
MFNYCFNLQSHDRKGVVTRIEYPVSKIGKLINQFANSPINLLHRARKYNKNMQNKANLQNADMNVTPLLTKGYEIFLTFCRRKNKAKQSQNKAKLQNIEMNVSSYITKGSVNFLTFCQRKNKAKQTQNKANFKNAQMNVTTSITSEYENIRLFSLCQNKAKQSQFKPNFSSKLGSFFKKLALKNEPPRPVPQVRLSGDKIFTFSEKIILTADFTAVDGKQIVKILTLTELESLSGAWLAGLFPFHHSRVSRQITAVTQYRREIAVIVFQSPCYPQDSRTCLAGCAAAFNINENIKALFRLDSLQRRCNCFSVLLTLEVIAELFFIDQQFSLALANPHPCHRLFASARAPPVAVFRLAFWCGFFLGFAECYIAFFSFRRFCHKLSLQLKLQFQCLWFLGLVLMLRPTINFQLF